jgi:catechol 2,3-dioxygenase-like lactoylglutathione lyase family enzyme
VQGIDAHVHVASFQFTEAIMLANENAVATLAVTDLARAKQFYEGKLGLTPIDSEGDEVVVFKCGDTKINVYRSRYAGTNAATALTWSVNDVDATVRELKDKGVSFEHYDMPGVKQQGDIHVAGDMKAAWFKDPDGNILSVVSG